MKKTRTDSFAEDSVFCLRFFSDNRQSKNQSLVLFNRCLEMFPPIYNAL